MHDFADEYRILAEQEIATESGGKPSKKRVWGRKFRWVVEVEAQRSTVGIQTLRAMGCSKCPLTWYFHAILVFAPPHRTVGNIVILLTLAVGGLELAIFVLLMRL